MLSQQNISATTPLGATMFAGGVTFRVWVPRAQAGLPQPRRCRRWLCAAERRPADEQGRLRLLDRLRSGRGRWLSLSVLTWWATPPAVKYKRDPYARELKNDVWPNCSSIVRDADAYPWHDAGFVIPDFSALVIYQFHIGVFAISTPGVASNFLDWSGSCVPRRSWRQHAAAPAYHRAGANGHAWVTPAATTSRPTSRTSAPTPPRCLATWRRSTGCWQQRPAPAHLGRHHFRVAQLKVLVDLAHLYGMAVAFDVVYGHGGGFEATTTRSTTWTVSAGGAEQQ